MTLLPGFADPVLDSQACFRAVLNAMARPGTVHVVTASPNPPPPLDPATAAALLTLIDADTPLWLDGAAVPAAPWIAFHCGAPAASPAEAVFGLALGEVPLGLFHSGTDDAPETGATLILQVTALGAGLPLRLSGPGLAAPAALAVTGLPPNFAEQWAVNHALFPRGIDLLLCAGDSLAAFPRTLLIEEG